MTHCAIISIEGDNMNTRRLRTKLENDKGFSVSLLGVEPDQGYMVALDGFEVKTNILDFEEVLDRYQETHYNKLLEPNMFLGAWMHKGIVYLDISEHVLNEAEAKFKARLRAQLAIWNITDGKEVLL